MIHNYLLVDIKGEGRSYAESRVRDDITKSKKHIRFRRIVNYIASQAALPEKGVPVRIFLRQRFQWCNKDVPSDRARQRLVPYGIDKAETYFGHLEKDDRCIACMRRATCEFPGVFCETPLSDHGIGDDWELHWLQIDTSSMPYLKTFFLQPFDKLVIYSLLEKLAFPI